MYILANKYFFVFEDTVVFYYKVAYTEKAKEAMGGLERSQKFLEVSKVDVCGKMAILEV